MRSYLLHRYDVFNFSNCAKKNQEKPSYFVRFDNENDVKTM